MAKRIFKEKRHFTERGWRKIGFFIAAAPTEWAVLFTTGMVLWLVFWLVKTTTSHSFIHPFKFASHWHIDQKVNFGPWICDAHLATMDTQCTLPAFEVELFIYFCFFINKQKACLFIHLSNIFILVRVTQDGSLYMRQEYTLDRKPVLHRAHTHSYTY